MVGYGEAFSKLILVGEHAVVYNIPAISIPFNTFKTEVIVSEKKGLVTIDSSFYSGVLEKGKTKVLGIITLVKEIFNYLNKDFKDIHLEIKSTILPERGLGSSASLSIAIIRAMFNYYNEDLKDEVLIKLALIAEKIYHAKTSGIDINTIVYNKPIWYVKNQNLEFFDYNFSGSIIIVDSKISSNTKKAVLSVRKKYDINKDQLSEKFETIKRIVYETRDSLHSNNIDQLGILLSENHQVLKELGVSSKRLNEISKLLIENGALGAKLTGGGIGGCVIGLARDEKHAKEIISKIKDYNCYIYNFGE